MTMAKNTKVAILWAGDTRSFKTTWPNYQGTILECCSGHDLDIDLYVSTYQSDDLNEFVDLYRPIHIDVENKEEVAAESKLKMLSLEDIPYNKWPESRLLSMLSMYYKLERAFKEFQKNKEREYDIVVRFRDRLLLSNPLSTLIERLSATRLTIPLFGDWRGGIGDTLALGSEELIQKYQCGILENLESYLRQGCHFHPENILLWHLVSQGVQLERPVFPVSLLQETRNKFIDTIIYTTRQQ